VRLMRHLALVLGLAAASGLIVTTGSLGVNAAMTRQLPYACNRVVVKSSASVTIPGQSEHQVPAGENQKMCSITAQPGWVEAFGIAGFFAGGFESILVLRRRRRERYDQVTGRRIPAVAL